MLHLEVGAPVVSPASVIGTVVIGVGVTILAGLLPAYSASRVTPLEALRPTFADSAKTFHAAGCGSVLP